jgi:hypothetical protein
MKNKLLKKNNWDIIDKPDSPYRYDENGQFTRHPSSRQKRQLARIYGTLCQSLSADMQGLQQEFEDKDPHKLRDPHALWRFLQTVTNVETEGEIALLMASAYHIQSDSPSVVHDTITAIQLKLRAAGEQMSDAQRRAALLISLEHSENSKGLVEAHESLKEGTYEEARRALVKKEETLQHTKTIKRANKQEARKVHSIALQEEERKDGRCREPRCGKWHRGKCWTLEVCRGCGITGHIERFCTSSKRHSRRERPDKRRREDVGGDCQLCGAADHLAPECTKPARRKRKVVKRDQRRSFGDHNMGQDQGTENHVVETQKGQHLVDLGRNQRKPQSDLSSRQGNENTTPSNQAALIPMIQTLEIPTLEEASIGVTRASDDAHEGRSIKLLLDTAAQAHVTNDKATLYRIVPCNVNVKGQIAQRIIKEKGKCLLEWTKEGVTTRLRLNNVLFQEDSKHLILATSLFESKDTCLTQKKGIFRLFAKDGTVMINGERDPKNGMYWMTARVAKSDERVVATLGTGPVIHERIHENNLLLWHQRLGHASFAVVLELYKLHLAKGIVLNRINFASLCTTCMVAKQQRSKAVFGEPKAICEVGEFWHVDIITMTSATIHGHYYGLLFTDDRSRFRFGQLLKTTAQLEGPIENLRILLLTQRKIVMKRIRCDQQFTTKPIKRLCETNGIVIEASPAHEKNYNSISERTNRTVQNMTFAMVKGAKLPIAYWGYSFNQSVYIINRLPTRTLEGHATPFSAWNEGDIPSLRFIRIFGCRAMKHISKEARAGKMGDKAEPCVHLGYDPINNVYNLGRLLHGGAITTAASVEFKEEQTTAWKTFDRPARSEEKGAFRESTKRKAMNEQTSDPEKPRQSKRQKPSAMEVYQRKHPDELIELAIQVQPGPERSNQRTPAKDWFRRQFPHETINMQTQQIEELNTPRSYWEAMRSPQRDEWKRAMEDEVRSHVEHASFTEVERPRHQRVLEGLWTFTRKRDGQPKARYVARGDQQQYPRDFQETHSPVLRNETFKILLSQIALKNWPANQLDVKTAFLNAEIDSEVYMDAPHGFRGNGSTWRLQKAIYGLRQASRLFYETFCAHAVDAMGFTQCEKDRCLFVKFTSKESEELTTVVALSTDDIIITGDDEQEATRTKKLIMDKFESRDLGELASYLGMEIERTGTTIKITQREYLDKILKKFNCENAKSVATPMQQNLKEVESAPGDAPVKFPFKECIGSLWHATQTRPDILMALSRLSQNQEEPSKTDVVGAKRILKYFNGTLDLGITFDAENQSPFFGVADASYAKEKNGRSRTGYVYFRAGAPIISKSQVQKNSPAQSATEAEFISGSEAVRKGLWGIEVMNELHFDVQTPVRLQLDNQQSIFVAQDVASHHRTMHIAVRDLLLTHQTRNGTFEPQYVATAENPADLLTKPLGATKFNKHRDTIMGQGTGNQYNLSRHIFTPSRRAEILETAKKLQQK